MMCEDPEKFFEYTRLYVDKFVTLTNMVKDRLVKRSCLTTITVEEQLAITLSYCNALWEVLYEKYLQPPTPERWAHIKSEFNNSPYKSGTKFYNYKHFYSIILMAVCDADYKFTLVHIGAQAAILDDTINTPKTDVLHETGKSLPCFFVADEAFPLRKNLMRPYPRKIANKEQLIFNYRLSRGRLMIENNFGILASRWRILRKPIIAHPKTVDSIIKATVVLHNFLRTVRANDSYFHNIVDNENQSGEVTPGLWRTEIDGFENIQCQGSRNYSHEVTRIRDELCIYFNSSAGSVPWQDGMI
ncbi:hypothetical protein RN001_001373 [Aquatica leii]|uniref:DDE Tnp4 domain-containing protein n=1 Tax=Aquatica leii TaxID=1421715 RepID=A0AAN7PFZ2_9COLE|nr:hypothetical protein RN001_001373 [Aquatica leii]